jgi:tryptophan synthase alpha chain
MAEAAAAGADGVILPDVPTEEADEAREAASNANLCHIGLVAPTSSPARRAEIARGSTGFVYQIASAGTTGERVSLPPSLTADVGDLRRHTALPICVGFGISTAEQVRQVCRIADGAIVGSAIIRRIADALKMNKPAPEVVGTVHDFLRDLCAV